ncbi:hypothetical protein N018_08465 [Pseudomonas syringae CC1557]|uniref:Uncharacterized protein n=1 Tax=Pseudomonas syringae CC1557 TaxID=1357279 RepID=W0MNY5_PSESX|nr:hypothetical protein [Pseudomonas syringae]AHG40279.1 hypothetical protein N018_08465 [Pseudomonas syringae CC1557]
MHTSTLPATSCVPLPLREGSFEAHINKQPLIVSSLQGRLALRSELTHKPDRWVWKVIADGKAGRIRASIGLYLDRDLEPGTHRLPGNDRIKVIYNERSLQRSTLYHSAHFQGGVLTLLEADPCTLRLRGHFSFSLSSINFEVTEGRFDLRCL